MNKFLRTVIAIIILAFIVSGCIYTNVQRPLGSDFNKTEIGSKEGMADTYSILWLFAWGNGGAKAAAENGNIKIIRHADTKVLSILFGLYTQVTTVVYGD